MTDPIPGDHVLVARAVDGDGQLQSAEERLSFPRGASGYHRIQVRIEG